MRTPLLSIVVPLYNEEESVGLLVDKVRASLDHSDNCDWELLLVDDGSRDNTAARAASLAARDSRVKLVRLAKNYGQTQAMQAGFDRVQGDVVITMDGDLQNDPADIPRLVATLQDGYDLVTGYRLKRQDAFLLRKVPSWVANRLLARLTGVRVRDNGCSLKAYRRELLSEFALYGDMHRFLPALAARANARIAEIPVRHHARRYGSSKYGLSRLPKVIIDILTLKAISSFGERPLALFGGAAFFAGVLGTALITVSLLQLVTPAALGAFSYVFVSAGLVMLVLACTLLMLGLVGERALSAVRMHRGFE